MAWLGIDLGGTKLALALGDEEQKPTRKFRRPLAPTGDWETDLSAMIEDVHRLLAEADVARLDAASTGPTLEGIGVSVPGPADPERGLLINPPNLPGWQNVPIGPRLADAFGVATRIESDANAAVLAEARFGAGQGVADLAYLTMSTGVGAGIINDGRILRGAVGAAGEAGHAPIDFASDAIQCACGLRGCLEAYVGGNAWRDRLQRTVPRESQILDRVDGQRDRVTSVECVAAAHEGDAFALAEVERWVDDLARGLLSLIMLCEPQRIILGTIAVAMGEALCFEPLREKLARRLWPHQAERLEIVPAALGKDLPYYAGLAVVPDPAEPSSSPSPSPSQNA